MLRPSATVELLMRDGTGSTSAVTLSTSSSLAVDTIAANAEAFAAIVVPLSDCALVGLRIKYKTAIDPDAVPDGPTLASHTGALFFSCDGGDTCGAVFVPGIKDTVFVSSGPGAGALIDFTNTDIAALISAVLDAGFCNPFAVPFVDCTDGYLQSRV